MIRLSHEPISVDDAIRAVSSPSCGGTATFVGTVRDDADTGPNGVLRYEAYIPMAVRLMEQLAEEIRLRYEGARIAILHRVGEIPVGEASVVIAVAAPHRAEAFDACRRIIETIKRDVPIWKTGAPCDHCAAPSAAVGKVVDVRSHLRSS